MFQLMRSAEQAALKPVRVYCVPLRTARDVLSSHQAQLHCSMDSAMFQLMRSAEQAACDLKLTPPRVT